MKDLIFLPIEITINKTIFNFDTPSHKTFGGLWDTRLVDESDPEMQHIIKQLPYLKLTWFKYNTQAMDVPPHIDVPYNFVKDRKEYQHIRKNEPAGYRVVLEGSTDKLEVFDGRQWRVAKLPSCPFAYVLNSTISLHRVVGEIGRKTLYFRGFLDEIKHREMILKNLNKYRDFAIFQTT
jgi:hypothetical protein